VRVDLNSARSFAALRDRPAKKSKLGSRPAPQFVLGALTIAASLLRDAGDAAERDDDDGGANVPPSDANCSETK